MNIITFIILSIFAYMVNSDAQAKNIDLFNAARTGNDSAIRQFVKQGGNINLIDHKSYNAFILAAYYNHPQTLKTLVALGSNPCTTDSKGNNALMGVVFKGHIKIARWLLNNTSCAVNHQNFAGQTALMMASLFGRENMIELLLKHGARPDIRDYQGNTSKKLAQAQGLSRVVEIIEFHFQSRRMSK